MLALAPQILFGLGEEGGEPHLSHKLSASGCLGLPRVSPTTYKGCRGEGPADRYGAWSPLPPCPSPRFAGRGDRKDESRAVDCRGPCAKNSFFFLRHSCPFPRVRRLGATIS